MSFVYALLTGAALGALAVFINYRITKKALEKNSNNAVMVTSVLRTAIDAAALASLFLLRGVLPFDFTYSLIAAAIVMSLGTIVFTFKLAKK